MIHQSRPYSSSDGPLILVLYVEGDMHWWIDAARHDLLAVPDSGAPIEFPDLHHVRRSEPQTVSAQVNVVRVGAPTEAWP
jgi:hypothetical protein